MPPLKRIRCVAIEKSRTRVEVGHKFLIVDDADVFELARSLADYIEERGRQRGQI